MLVYTKDVFIKAIYQKVLQDLGQLSLFIGPLYENEDDSSCPVALGLGSYNWAISMENKSFNGNFQWK